MRRFSKMHGAGNDFVVLDLRREDAVLTPAQCRRLAHRAYGVGCDQILTLHPPQHLQAHARYAIHNADGSPAGQCGNGARCVAAWLARHDRIEADIFWLESPSGLHQVWRRPGEQWQVSMGHPRWLPADIPLLGFAEAGSEYDIAVGEHIVRIGALSMGNPHALIEVPDVDQTNVESLGRALQESPCFPDSVNVGFAQICTPDHIRLRVYERGAGETLACGSGACAAAAILMRRGQVARTLQVSLPGGDLWIDWPDDEAEIRMSGPACFVFDGELDAAFC